VWEDAVDRETGVVRAGLRPKSADPHLDEDQLVPLYLDALARDPALRFARRALPRVLDLRTMVRLASGRAPRSARRVAFEAAARGDLATLRAIVRRDPDAVNADGTRADPRVEAAPQRRTPARDASPGKSSVGSGSVGSGSDGDGSVGSTSDGERSDEETESCLHAACAALQVETVRFLLQETRTAVDAENEDGETPLLQTSGRPAARADERARKLETMRLLLEHGADPNRGNGHDFPLFSACFVTDLGAARLLCGYGARLDEPNSRGMTARVALERWRPGFERWETGSDGGGALRRCDEILAWMTRAGVSAQDATRFARVNLDGAGAPERPRRWARIDFAADAGLPRARIAALLRGSDGGTGSRRAWEERLALARRAGRADTVETLRRACRPWSEETHSLFPRAHGRLMVAVLLVEGRRRLLPAELWLRSVLKFLRRAPVLGAEPGSDDEAPAPTRAA
jgi:hypothetical protein